MTVVNKVGEHSVLYRMRKPDWFTVRRLGRELFHELLVVVYTVDSLCVLCAHGKKTGHNILQSIRHARRQSLVSYQLPPC